MFVIGFFDQDDKERMYWRCFAVDYKNAVRQLKSKWHKKIIFHELIKEEW
jgi:hypothetical protein